jgi:hypothetical protein
MSSDHLPPFSRTRFENALNETFTVQAFGAQGTAVEIALNLIEVTPRRSPPGNEQFSNLFRGPSDPALGQGLYRVLSPSFGAEDLFLVPVGLDPDGARLYEAFVNRMITTQ